MKILCSKQAASLFSRCSNAVKNVLFRSFCTPMYASQLWWNFRKSCMQRLRVAYNSGCRALYNLPCRTSVSSHDSSGSMYHSYIWGRRKNMHLFLEKCRRSNNVMVACFDAVRSYIYSSLFFEHYNRILLCNWVLGHCSVWGCACHNAFVLYLGLTSLGISVPLCSSVVQQCCEQIMLRMRLWNWGSASIAVTKRSVK